MSGAFQLPPCKRAATHSILLLGAWLGAVAPAVSQTTYFWNTGDGTWDSNPANWDPAGPPAADDEAILGLFIVATDAEVTLGLDTPALSILEISYGVDLMMNGFEGEAVTVDLSGSGSSLLVENGSSFDNNDGTTDVSAGGMLLIEEGGIYDGGEVTLSSGGNAQLAGGEVTGGLIRNDGGTIRGHGRITSSSINNFGAIEADGGTLVIDTMNPSQLDGAAPNNGQGILRAVTGDLEVASNVTTVFNGLLEVGSTQTFTMSQPGSRFRNALASEDDDGSGDFGQIELDGGTLFATTFEQASQLTATKISMIDAENITFESGSLTEIIAAGQFDRLQLRQSNTIIEPGATFAGGGSLQVMVGSTLTLLDGAHLDTIRLTNQGSVAIGSSAGAATVDSFWQISTGAWTVEIGGTAPGTQHDQLIVTNDAQLDGTLEVELIDLGAGLFAPSLGDTFEILVANAGVAGAFASEVLPPLASGLGWDVIYNTNNVVLQVVEAAIPGDFDGDGDVDGADFVVWQTNFPTETGATLATGDADGDGDVDGADFVIWQTNFPFTPSPDATAVPEPSTWLLSLLALAGGARSAIPQNRRRGSAAATTPR